MTSSESGGESINDLEAENTHLDPTGPADEPVDEPGEAPHETPGVGNIGHADEPGEAHETPGVGDTGYSESGV